MYEITVEYDGGCYVTERRSWKELFQIGMDCMLDGAFGFTIKTKR